MKKTGIIIIIVGLLFTVFTGFNFITQKKIVDMGKLEITQNKPHKLSWPPILGVVVMAIGGSVLVFGLIKK